MAFIGHNICVYDAGCSRKYGLDQNPILGITFANIGLSMITHDKASITESVTVVHEFGHFIGALDHYGSGCKTTAQMNAVYPGYNFNTNCMYGEDFFNDPDNMSELTICAGCQKLIQACANQTDHDGGSGDSTQSMNDSNVANAEFYTNCLYGESQEDIRELSQVFFCPGCRELMHNDIVTIQQGEQGGDDNDDRVVFS